MSVSVWVSKSSFKTRFSGLGLGFHPCPSPHRPVVTVVIAEKWLTSCSGMASDYDGRVVKAASPVKTRRNHGAGDSRAGAKGGQEAGKDSPQPWDW